jgi:hypothetical protein
VVPAGPDSFIVEISAVTIDGVPTAANAKATSRYCAKLGKYTILRHTETTERWSRRNTLVFSHVAADV